MAKALTFFACMALGGVGLYVFYFFGPLVELRSKRLPQSSDEDFAESQFTQFAMIPAAGIAFTAVMTGHWSSALMTPLLLLHCYLVPLIFGSLAVQARRLGIRVKYWKISLYDGFALTLSTLCSALLASLVA